MHSATLKSDVTKGSCCHPFEQGDANNAWSELDKEKRACSVVLSFKDLLCHSHSQSRHTDSLIIGLLFEPSSKQHQGQKIIFGRALSLHIYGTMGPNCCLSPWRGGSF